MWSWRFNTLDSEYEFSTTILGDRVEFLQYNDNDILSVKLSVKYFQVF